MFFTLFVLFSIFSIDEIKEDDRTLTIWALLLGASAVISFGM